jgi:hypothetical protein
MTSSAMLVLLDSPLSEISFLAAVTARANCLEPVNRSKNDMEEWMKALAGMWKSLFSLSSKQAPDDFSACMGLYAWKCLAGSFRYLRQHPHD